MTDQQPKKEIMRLSISEAAKLFGVSSQTIRRAIKNEEVVYIIVGGRYKLNFESLIKWSQEKTTVRNKLATHGMGQYVEKWSIRNKLYSPNLKKQEDRQPPEREEKSKVQDQQKEINA